RLAFRLALTVREDALENAFKVVVSFLQRRKRKIPAGVVRDRRGVVQAVGARKDCIVRGSVAQAPALLEPADVTDLPEVRIDDGELRAEQPLVAERGGDAQGAAAARLQVFG